MRMEWSPGSKWGLGAAEDRVSAPIPDPGTPPPTQSSTCQEQPYGLRSSSYSYPTVSDCSPSFVDKRPAFLPAPIIILDKNTHILDVSKLSKGTPEVYGFSFKKFLPT